MRRRRSSGPLLRGALCAAVALAGAGPIRLQAQSAADEGALFLLLPVGARSVARGQAVVASRESGSEAVWWNPAGLAAVTRTEAAIHHSQSLFGTGDALTLVVPSSVLGVIAASVNVLTLAETPVTDSVEGTEIGTAVTRGVVYAASYATNVVQRVSAGLTYKIVQFRTDCSGTCPDELTRTATTSALDFGTQFSFQAGAPVVVGVAVRNLGVRLQVNDSPQSDPLPSRIQVGAQVLLVPPERYGSDFDVRIGVDVVDELEVHRPAARLGTDVAWQRRAHLRLGYAFEGGGSLGGGPSLGLGLVRGGLAIDIARVVSGLSADAGQAPTYLSLRYAF